MLSHAAVLAHISPKSLSACTSLSAPLRLLPTSSYVPVVIPSSARRPWRCDAHRASSLPSGATLSNHHFTHVHIARTDLAEPADALGTVQPAPPPSSRPAPNL